MSTMKAMLFNAPNSPLRLADIQIPTPGKGQVLIKVNACGICHTDLHILDGELNKPTLPLVLGHQIVGVVAENGLGAKRFGIGERVGVPWLGSTDGKCRYCLQGQENLCDYPVFTGYDVDGGFAEYALADERFCFILPTNYSDIEVAPLLCAGLIGYRTYRLAGDNIESIGIYGFGAAAHIITQVARHAGKRVYAFTRPGDFSGQEFALSMGAIWAGDSSQSPPERLDSALIFAPVGPLVISALKVLNKGGTVVCGGIHMSDIPAFPYSLLWEERTIHSVANLTRKDGEEFLALAPTVPVHTDVKVFPLAETGEALNQLRHGQFNGSAVIDLSL